ncbi:metalloprotease TIKI2 isoform X2 [Vulpes lagopus]|uniref:metalloprotease TIKI2 isoform X2 n=1 Tax=Vulpes lagopus TaxID=494514 RepID=UPI001BC90C83|nr:metalloprotease TIKI2 isoform X2 [Vulpes lagopus]
MLAALAGPLLAALLAAARARPQPPDAGQCRPPGSQRELNSFLWTIRRDPPAYLFGTIHVPYTRVWDFIPDNSKAAFQASARVYFELDLTDPYTISALASCQLLPHGENLQDVLPRDLYWRLKRHLDYVKLMMPSWMTPAQRGKGLYADYLFNAIAGNWERKRPVWVMLMVNSLTETDVRSRGVPVLDLYLAQQAEKMRKSTGAVERVEEQCHPLNGLNFSQVLFALNQTLLQHESVRAGSLQAPYTTEDLIKHYNCGDLNAVIFNHDTAQVIFWETTQSSTSFGRQGWRWSTHLRGRPSTAPPPGALHPHPRGPRPARPQPPPPPPLSPPCRRRPPLSRPRRRTRPCPHTSCSLTASASWRSLGGRRSGTSGRTSSSGRGSSMTCGSASRTAPPRRRPRRPRPAPDRPGPCSPQSRSSRGRSRRPPATQRPAACSAPPASSAPSWPASPPPSCCTASGLPDPPRRSPGAQEPRSRRGLRPPPLAPLPPPGAWPSRAVQAGSLER